MTLKERDSRGDLSELIAENFGANATYVETLLARWRSDPALVDESWRAYFDELVGSNGDRAAESSANPAAVPPETPSDGGGAATAPARTKGPTAAVPAIIDAKAETLPIRGAALKIVENMETSLGVPTATSQRQIPVKLLDENRRLINRHLQEN